ncbi:MAG: PilW family protein [Gammaproteobacteria bacterium]
MNTCARRGFGLVELMVALAISSLLLLGITQLFISSKDSYRIIEGLSRLQENARFAIDSLSRDLRQSGLYGCRSGVAMWGDGQIPRFQNAIDPGGTNFATAFNNGNALQGFDVNNAQSSAWLPAVPAGAIAAPPNAQLPGSDVLVIRGSLGAGRRVRVAPETGTKIELEDDIDADDFTADELLLITNCDGATLFTAGAVRDTLNEIDSTQNDLGQPFDNTAEIYKARTIVYFIRNNTDGVSSLFRREFGRDMTVTPRARELVTGVQNMQILYGVDGVRGVPDTVADAYLDANQLAGSARVTMNDVVSLRIGLLMVTPDEVRRQAATTAPIPVLGVNVPQRADGRSLHQLVVSTITLRNRAL